MAYSETITFEAADRLTAGSEEARLPYYIAIPLWLSLSALAWSPIVMLFNAVVS